MNHTVRNLLIATALMILGIVLTTSFINKERKSLSRGKQEITIYVAKKEIPPGTPGSKLEEGGYLDTKEVVREDAPPQPVSDLKDLKDLTSNDTVFEGESLSFRAFKEDAGLSAPNSIKGSQRLVAFAIKAPRYVAGMIRPGDRVDMYACSSAMAAGGAGGPGFKSLQTPATLKDKPDEVANNLGVGDICWFPARDVVVQETPESLKPASDGEEVKVEAVDPTGDPAMFVFVMNDKQAAQVTFAERAAGDLGIQLMLRPASGDTETSTPPLTGPYAAIPATSKLPEAQNGLDPGAK